ncbi:MAG TPA: class I SAM-dependent methyltransferase [Candidatus Hydrogenedens sp.]|nr:class I SAM-dependent methyltransferase [Candidatus Hydrogenedens sp.]
MNSKENNDWYLEAFGKWYPIVYHHRDAKEAEKQINFICSELKLKKNSKVLDLCCGYGRHLSFLKQRIPFTVGADLSVDLLEQAKNLFLNEIYLVRCDVRFLPFQSNTFDVVLNLFTSFGYFEDDNENIQQIQQVSSILKSGGYFFLDYLNPIQAQKIKMLYTTRKVEDYTIDETRWYEHTSKLLKKKVEVYNENKQLMTSYTESIKIYLVEEITEIFSKQQLSILKIYGNYQKENFSNESSRIIIISKKK